MTIKLEDALNLSQTGTPKRQTRQEKIDQIIQLIFQGHKSFSEIAKEVGISRRTAYRYWNRWKHSEEAQQVDWEWWGLYSQVKIVNPAKALECLTRIKHRMTTEKVEVEQTVKEFRIVASWNNKYNAQPSTGTHPILGNLNSTSTLHDSES